MLIDLIIDGFIALIEFIFGLLPSLPEVPATIQGYINQFLDMLFQGMGLIDIFLDLTTFKLILVAWLATFQFHNIFRLIMFIAKKIPFLGFK